MANPERTRSDETVVFSVRHHPIVLWKPAVAELVYLAIWMVAISVSSFFREEFMVVAGFIVFAPIFVWSTLSLLRFARAGLTLAESRLVYSSGILSRREREIPLSSITDVSVFQTVLERSLGVGDLLVQTSPESPPLPFIWMPRPGELKQAIMDQIHSLHETAHSETTSAIAREVAQHLQRTQPTAELSAVPPERPPIYSEIVDQIERLDQMRQRGVLSEEEFQGAKEALLDRLDKERGG
jgi:uncharacterized membrane protein YdbT with pleckstrin-like domain